MSRQIFDSVARERALRPPGEVVQQPGSGQPDESDDPSDFCDFGYDIVSIADSQNDRRPKWDETVQAVP